MWYTIWFFSVSWSPPSLPIGFPAFAERFRLVASLLPELPAAHKSPRDISRKGRSVEAKSKPLEGERAIGVLVETQGKRVEVIEV
jgi:hypothetical protein